jgi:hypothetical protein
MHVHSSIPKSPSLVFHHRGYWMAWSWWCKVAVSRITAFMHHLNGGGIDCACAEVHVSRLDRLRVIPKPVLEMMFGERRKLQHLFGWEDTHLGRIWQFMTEHGQWSNDCGKRRSTGHLLLAVQPQHRWQIDLIGRARAIWWVDQVRSATWPKPCLNSIMAAHASRLGSIFFVGHTSWSESKDTRAISGTEMRLSCMIRSAI